MKTGKKIGGLLTLFIIISVSLWLASLAAADLRDWRDSDTWLATQSTRLDIQPKTSQVTYTYQVGGREYSGQRVHFFVSAPYDSERHLAWIDEHRRADKVTVYYDPDAPERAVLVRRVDASVGISAGLIASYICLICGLPIFFFGGFWLWIGRQFFEKS